MIFEILPYNSPCCIQHPSIEEQLTNDYWCQVKTCVATNDVIAYKQELFGYDSECAWNAVNNFSYLLDLLIYIYRDWQLHPTKTIDDYYTEYDINCIKKTFMCCGCNITNALAVFGLVEGIIAPKCIVNPVLVYPSLIHPILPDRCICSGTLFTLTPVANVPGTIICWSRAAVIGISNPAANGCGTISETLINTGTTIVTVTYVITMTLGSIIVTDSFDITVCPMVRNEKDTGENVGCPGTFMSSINFVSNPQGAIYTWTNSNTATGIGASGTGNIPGWIAPINNTGQNITGIITATPTLNYCTGTPMTITVIIWPTPIMTQLGDQEVCECASVVVPGFTDNLIGTTYAWKKETTTLYLSTTEYGTGNIPPWTAPCGGAGIIVITVTPTSINLCVGPEMIFTIIINPIPLLTSVTYISMYCNNQLNYIPTSNIIGATFQWTRAAVLCCDNPPASGTGNINEILYCNAQYTTCDVEYKIQVCANGCCSAWITLLVHLIRG